MSLKHNENELLYQVSSVPTFVRSHTTSSTETEDLPEFSQQRCRLLALDVASNLSWHSSKNHDPVANFTWDVCSKVFIDANKTWKLPQQIQVQYILIKSPSWKNVHFFLPPLPWKLPKEPNRKKKTCHLSQVISLVYQCISKKNLTHMSPLKTCLLDFLVEITWSWATEHWSWTAVPGFFVSAAGHAHEVSALVYVFLYIVWEILWTCPHC